MRPRVPTPHSQPLCLHHHSAPVVSPISPPPLPTPALTARARPAKNRTCVSLHTRMRESRVRSVHPGRSREHAHRVTITKPAEPLPDRSRLISPITTVSSRYVHYSDVIRLAICSPEVEYEVCCTDACHFERLWPGVGRQVRVDRVRNIRHIQVSPGHFSRSDSWSREPRSRAGRLLAASLSRLLHSVSCWTSYFRLGFFYQVCV